MNVDIGLVMGLERGSFREAVVGWNWDRGSILETVSEIEMNEYKLRVLDMTMLYITIMEGDVSLRKVWISVLGWIWALGPDVRECDDENSSV